MSGANGDTLVGGRSMRDIFDDELELSPDSYDDSNRRSPVERNQGQPVSAVRSPEKPYPSDDRSSTGGNQGQNPNRPTSTYDGIPWDDALQPPGDKPKRPLSAYNFFFQLERERIINSDLKDRDADVKYTVDDVARIAMVQQQKAKSGKTKEKRSHRRTHGKISFGDLARTIANKWKKLDEPSKSIFEGSATMEKERYRKELAEWNKKQKKWKEATAKMTQQRGMYPPSIVTPTQVPKTTVQSNDHHIMTTLMHQQRKLLQENNGVSSPNANIDDSGRQPYPEYRPGTAADLYEAEREFYRQDLRQNRRFDQGYGSTGYDYDRLTDDTYQMAQMTLPRYQQMWMQQRRMQEMALMQQQQEQMRQQITGRHQQDDFLRNPMDRALDRAMARDRSLGDLALDRELDRNIDRGLDRGSMDRTLDRALDRNIDRTLDRNMDRALDRPLDRPLDRALDRPLDRTLDRALDRTWDRPVDRNMDRTSTPTDMLLKEELALEASPHPYHQGDGLRASYDI